MTSYDSALALPPGHLAGPPAHRMPPPPPRVEWRLAQSEKRISGPPSKLSSEELNAQLREAERLLGKLQREYHHSDRKLSDAKNTSGYYASIIVSICQGVVSLHVIDSAIFLGSGWR